MRIYQGAGSDTTTDYYYIDAHTNENFRIGRSNDGGDADILLENDGNIKLAQNSGTVQVGDSDATPGVLTIYGGSGAAGGELRIYQGALSDTTTDYYYIDANTNENFRIGRDNEGGGADILMETDGTIKLAQISGAVQVGVSDATPGVLSLFGGGTGEQSGELRLYNNADDDGTTEYWGIEPIDGSGSLGFYDATNLVATLTADHSFALGTDDVDLGTLVLYGDGTGSDEGGEIRLHTAADHDATYDFWRLDAYQDDFRIGTNSGGTEFTLTPTGVPAFAGLADGGLIKADTSGTFSVGSTFATSSATGTNVLFTSLPAWITQIFVIFSGISPNSDDNQLLLQIGDSGGIETGSYSSAASSPSGSISASDGFVLNFTNEFDAAQNGHGYAILTKQVAGGTAWACVGNINVGGVVHSFAGERALDGPLTRIQALWQGGTTQFDSGNIRISYF